MNNLLLITLYNVKQDGLMLRNNITEKFTSWDEAKKSLEKYNVTPPNWDFIPSRKASYILEGENYSLGHDTVVAHIRFIKFD